LAGREESFKAAPGGKWVDFQTDGDKHWKVEAQKYESTAAPDVAVRLPTTISRGDIAVKKQTGSTCNGLSNGKGGWKNNEERKKRGRKEQKGRFTLH